MAALRRTEKAMMGATCAVKFGKGVVKNLQNFWVWKILWLDWPGREECDGIVMF